MKLARRLRRVAIAAAGVLGAIRPYTVRHGLAKGLRRRGGAGYLPERFHPERLEEYFLRNLYLAGSTVYDVGGFEGTFTLFFARAVGSFGRVVTFEPNPLNYERLRENLRLNDVTNVDLRPIGLGSKPETKMLVFNPARAAYGHIRRNEEDTAGGQIPVAVDTLDRQIAAHSLPPPDLIKIDVEGYEAEVLRGARATIEKYRPSLLIEVHGPSGAEKSRNARELVEIVQGHGYAIRHVETGRPVDEVRFAFATEGHLFCTARP